MRPEVTSRHRIRRRVPPILHGGGRIAGSGPGAHIKEYGVAKRTSKKKTAATRGAARRPAAKRKATRTAGKRTAGKRAAPKRTAAKRTAASRASAARGSAGRTSASGTNTRTARRKTAARSAASRSTRRDAKPPKPSAAATAATAVKGAMAGAVAAVAKRLPGAAPDMDAITLLETDHREMERLLDQGAETTERAVKSRTELLGTITKTLAVHELIEEKLLYPALKKYPEAREIVLEGFQEHHVADLIVKELHDVAKDDEQWGAKFKVLKENIEHHIEEEEGKMFRTARGVMSREELQDLGARMARMKTDAEKRQVS
jgi:hemerythrin-like domain-containing protein